MKRVLCVIFLVVLVGPAIFVVPALAQGDGVSTTVHRAVVTDTNDDLKCRISPGTGPEDYVVGALMDGSVVYIDSGVPVVEADGYSWRLTLFGCWMADQWLEFDIETSRFPFVNDVPMQQSANAIISITPEMPRVAVVAVEVLDCLVAPNPRGDVLAQFTKDAEVVLLYGPLATVSGAWFMTNHGCWSLAGAGSSVSLEVQSF